MFHFERFMKTILACLTLSLFVSVASLRAADDKAPVAKPAPTAEKAKASSTATTASSDSDCCCGTDTVCKMPVRKVAMSPKAAALLANK